MVRGIEGRAIFLGDNDRRDFVARLDLLLPEAGCQCFAWVLLPNHFHLVLRVARGGLSQFMARLNTGYARGFNLRHDRTGYLFQNRFKSRLVLDDRDLMGLVLYVHRNPLAAGLVNSVAELEHDPWCGHGALVGTRPPRPFESVGAALTLFADEPAEAMRRVREWMGAPGASGLEDSLNEVLGAHAGSTRESTGQADFGTCLDSDTGGSAIEVCEGDDFDESMRVILAGVSGRLGIPVAHICSGSPRRAFARARAAVVYLAVDELGVPGRTIASTLGISASGVSRARRRGKVVAEEEGLHVVGTPDLLRN